MRLWGKGFDFGKVENAWISHFADLAKHRGKKGGLPKWDPREVRAWCHVQQQRKRRGILLGYREKGLNEIGFRIGRHRKPWSFWLEELKAYRAKYGHCAVPIHNPAHKSLGQWVFNQRMMFRAGILKAERKADLDVVGFVWDARSYRKLRTAISKGGGSGN